MLIRRVLVCSAVIFLILFAQSNIAGAVIMKETAASNTPALSVTADGAKVDEDSASLTTSGSFSAGVDVSGKGSALSLGAADVTTTGYASSGAVAGGVGSSISFGGATNISTGGVSSHGAYASGAASSMTFSGDTSVITSGGSAYGAAVSGDGSQMTFGSTTSLVTGGIFASGAVVSGDGSSMTFDGETILKTTGTLASAAVVTGRGSSVSFNDKATITTGSGRSYGAIVSGDGSAINFGGETSITTGGANAYGAYVAGKGSHVGIDGAATIATEGSGAHGTYITGTGSSIGIDGATTITTVGKGAHGAYVNAAGSTISFNDVATITTNDELAYGAYVNYAPGEASKISFNGGAVIATTGEKAHGVYTMNTSASIAFKNGAEISVSGNGAYALYAALGSITSTQSGKYAVTGDMVTSSGIIDLNMAAGSLFTGGTNAGNGDISLIMTDSRWNVTNNSNLTLLNLDSTFVDYSAAASGTSIITGALDGPGGTFVMKTDIVGGTSDKLAITDTMNGTQHNITVINSGSEVADGSEVITLVDTADQTGSFQLTNAVELGAWRYGLQQVNGGMGSEWQLYATGLSSIADAAVNTVYAAYLLNYAETQTLIQRLGDLRTTPHLSGFWFKAHGGSFEFKPNGVASSFDMDYWGVQLGYDRKIEIGWDGDVYAGVMFGYGKGDLDYTYGGSGEIDSKTVGVYSTFKHKNGFFADLVLKYQWMDSDFEVLDSAGTRVTGNGASSGGFGASLELGKRISFAQKQQKSGWYVEPQVQLSLQRLGGEDVIASNGLHIAADHYTSVQGRLGMLVGYETEGSNFYAKASKVKEFSGDVAVMANSQTVDISFGSDWWVYGLGFTSRLDNGSSIYFDLERASGGLFTQEWAVKAGWRMAF